LLFSLIHKNSQNFLIFEIELKEEHPKFLWSCLFDNLRSLRIQSSSIVFFPFSPPCVRRWDGNKDLKLQQWRLRHLTPLPIPKTNSLFSLLGTSIDNQGLSTSILSEPFHWRQHWLQWRKERFNNNNIEGAYLRLEKA